MKFRDFGLIGICRWIYNAIQRLNFDTFRIHSTLKRKIIMRTNIILLLMISAFLQISAATYAQKITLTKTNANIVDIFKEIQTQSGYDFIYSNRLISRAEKINITVKEASLLEVLEKCFEDQPFTYLINNNTIVIKEKVHAFQRTTNVPAVVKLAINIKGKATDERGQPLAGVSVTLNGTSLGTVTDAEGRYAITVPDADGILMFSFVGFASREIPIGNNRVIDVILSEKESSINEVVVIGYGSQSKKLISTAITTVGGDKLANRPLSNVTQALVGQVSGVQLQQVNGAPGAAPSVRIRGNGSITSGNSPLYVVDGFPMSAGDFNSISPNDIESVDILKDAASAAIYGSRAGNGVIIVTTKKGKPGKTKFTFNSLVGFDEITNKIDVLGPEEYVEMAKESLINQGLDIPEYFTNSDLWTYTDWQDVIFRKAPLQNYQFGASGGNEKIRFNMSMGYLDQQGIVLNSYMKRYNLNAGFDAKLNKYISGGVHVLSSYTEGRDQVTRGVNTEGGVGGIIAVALSAPPILPIWRENGDYFIIFQDDEALKAFNVGLTNPLNKIHANKDYNKTFRPTASAYIEIEPVERLKIRSSFMSSLTAGKRDFYVESFLSKGGTNTGNISTPDLTQITAGRSSGTNHNVYWSNTASYDFVLNDHNFIALVGYDVSTQNNFSTSVSPRTDINTPVAFDNTIIKNVEGAILKSGSSGQNKYAFDGVFGRLNYHYKSKYLLSASIRRDRSSRFGPNNRAGVFLSISGAWNITEEGFFDFSKAVSLVKIRASYGETGNDQLGGNYPWISSLSKSSYVFGANGDDVTVVSYLPGGFTNAGLGWEKNRQTDIGVDLELFDYRLSLSIDAYNRNSNTILSASVPSINGKANVGIQNIGNVRNRGLEFMVNSKNFVGNFKWNSNVNISFNRNEITRLAPGQTQLNNATAGSVWANVIRNYVGRPMGDLYMYVVEGTFNNGEDLDKYAKNGTQDIGDLRFKDVDGDGKITASDMELVGNYQPDFTFGFGNTLSYKGFDLSVLLDGTYGGEIINVIERPISLGRNHENNLASALGRWKSENDPGSGYFHKAGTKNLGSNIGPSTRYLYESSFLRVRNVALGYTIPSTVFNKYGIQSARFYIAGQNLHTFTKFPGYNPEGNHTGDNATVNGADEGSYPLARNLSFGINISF